MCFVDEANGIDDLSIGHLADADDATVVKVYSLHGILVGDYPRSVLRHPETSLPAGIYVVGGKKLSVGVVEWGVVGVGRGVAGLKARA